MAKPLSELRKKLSPEVQAAARAKAVGIVAEMSLAETRKLPRSQALGIAQPNVSQIEKRPDKGGTIMVWNYAARRTTYADGTVVYDLVECYSDEVGMTMHSGSVCPVGDSVEDLAKWLRQAAEDVEVNPIITEQVD